MHVEPDRFEYDASNDTLAYDSQGRPVLTVRVRSARDAVGFGILDTLDSMRVTGVEFGMFADPDVILIFRSDAAEPGSPICRFEAADILLSYYPGYDGEWISWDFLETLISAWLRDLAYHWKNERPVGSEQIEAIGLADRLAGGTTRDGFERAHTPLCRD